MKKLLVVMVVLGMTSAVYAWEGPILIGDWEQSLDGWTSWNSNNSFSYSTVGVTLDNYSLRVQVNGVGSAQDNPFYSRELNFKFLGDDRQFFLSNNKFEIDVSTLASEWTHDTGAGWETTAGFRLVIICGNTTGQSMVGYLPWAEWDPVDADVSRHLVFDYSFQREIVADWERSGKMGEGSYIEFFIVDEFATFTLPVVWYLDNAQLTPEPTTICLLGLGGLALLKKRGK